MSDPATRLEELQSQLKARRAALKERVDSLTSEGGDGELPPLISLKSEREQLIQDIRHSKDEGDAIMRQIEVNEEAVNVYRVAARVQRFENFAKRADAYVANDLPAEIENVAAADHRHSEDEVAAYISELQAQRENELKRIAALQERTSKRAKSIRNGPKVEHGERGSRRFSSAKEEEVGKDEQQTVSFTEEQRNGNNDLMGQVKELRQQRSKLQVEILDEKHKHEKKISEMKIRIRHADLAAKADARRCGELNTSNAALTTNSQILMGQLHSEHYGMEKGPSQQLLIKMREEEEKKAKAKQEKNEDENKNNNNGEDGEEAQNGNADGSPKGGYKRTDSRATDNSNGGSGVSSRRQSLSKPPLVALKRTESQRQREAAVKADMDHRREEEESVQRSHRRESYQGSEASASAQRPPRVASLQTESTKNRQNSVSSSRREY